MRARLRGAIMDGDLVSEQVKIEVIGEILKMSAVGDVGSTFSEWERGATSCWSLRSRRTAAPASP